MCLLTDEELLDEAWERALAVEVDEQEELTLAVETPELERERLPVVGVVKLFEILASRLMTRLSGKDETCPCGSRTGVGSK